MSSSIGTMLLLPGLNQRTAEYASKRIGQATVWQATSIDVKQGDQLDSERSAEVGRALLDASEVRRLVKDLRTFHTQTRHFPASFVEINERLWHTRPPPDYGTTGRTAHTRNYEYRYTRVNADTCAFWALPTGPRRHYAAAYFVVVAPQWLRVWQGKALSDEQIAQLPTVPTPDELARWQMNEQAARRQQVR